MKVKFYPGCGKIKFDNKNYGVVVGKAKGGVMKLFRIYKLVIKYWIQGDKWKFALGMLEL